MNFDFSNFWSHFKKPGNRGVDPEMMKMYGAAISPKPSGALGGDKPSEFDPSSIMMYACMQPTDKLPLGDDESSSKGVEPRDMMMYGMQISTGDSGEITKKSIREKILSFLKLLFAFNFLSDKKVK